MKKKNIKPIKSNAFSSDSLLLEKEETLFGVNHTIVGSMLAEKWDLSERICTVLEYHHYPSFWNPNSIPLDYNEDIATICISDFIVHHLYGNTKQLPEPSPEYFNILGFSPPIDNIVTIKLREKIQEAKEYVNNVK